MYIKSMSLVRGTDNVIIRHVDFHLGTNFVIDAEDSSKHNKVGKTTFLKLIDIAMGATDRKNIYFDPETNSYTEELRRFIESEKVRVELVLSESFHDTDSDSTRLKVELFPKGKYYIGDTRFSQRDYPIELNRIIFSNDENVPTFRRLIKSFMRVSLKGDDSSFLKTLAVGNSNAVYRSIYDYLFDISDASDANAFAQAKSELNKISEAESRYKKVIGAGDIDSERQILVALEREHSKVETALADLVSKNAFLQNRAYISSKRAEYSCLCRQLDDVNFCIQRSKDELLSIKQEQLKQSNDTLYSRFYEEVCSIVPGVSKTFEQMISFNESVCRSREELLRDSIAEFELQRKKIEKAMSVIESDEVLVLVSDSDLSAYEDLSARVSQLNNDLGKRKEIIESLDAFQIKKSSKLKDMERFGEKHDKKCAYQESMDLFNEQFTSMAQKINGESPVLVYSVNPDSFPVSISNLGGSSTGTRKSLIAAFDLAYQRYIGLTGKRAPRFVVHDVLENIEGEDLREVITQANESGGQYIVAILKEKLDSSQITAAEQERLELVTLSSEEKLFKC